MKIFVSLLLILLLLLGLNIEIDKSAMELHDEVFQRAMVAFGLAKGLNAVISLIQGTELSITPIGIGLNLSVGEVLDPFNDMVERFSWVMLFASVSLGLQKILLLLSSKLFLQVALGVSIGFSLIVIWIKQIQNATLITISFKMMILLLLLRFSAVIFVYSSELLYTSLLQTEYQNASGIVAQTKEKLETIQSKSKRVIESKRDVGFMEKFRSKSNAFIDSLKLSEKLNKIKQNIEEASKNIITLITLFIAQTVMLPLLFLWLFISSIKLLFRADFDKEKLLGFVRRAY